MTEKRFVEYVQEEWSVIFDNEEITSLNLDETIDTLNELNDENEQLKLENGEMKDYLGRLEEVNEQLKQRISELKEDNDHKFWKLQFMHQFNTTELIVHEIGRAIEHGYEVSDKFQEYLNELKVHNEKGKEKAIEQEKW